VPKDSRNFGKGSVRELVGGRLPAGNAHVNKGTVFVRPAVVTESAESMWLDTEFHGSWQLINSVAAGGVEQELMDAGRSFSPGVAMEASAFGCDSKVLERAVRRLLENATAHSLDSVEITELRRHQDSGLDYVTILALGRTRLQELPSEGVGHPVSSNA
jgi:hypothetical protein